MKRTQDLGMIVDVAQAHPVTLRDIVEMTSRPVIDSHTNPSPVEDPSMHKQRAIRRMRLWREMESIAKTGGVICTWPLTSRLGLWKREAFKDWASEVLEMKKRVGIEHVGLGTDGGGMIPWLISGYRDVRDLAQLAAAMQEAGLSRDKMPLWDAISIECSTVASARLNSPQSI